MSTVTERRAPASTGPLVAATVFTVVAWSSAFVVVRAVAPAFSAGGLAFGRLLVGALALGVALGIRRSWVRPTAREWLLVALCGLAWFAVYNVALNAAEQRLDAGTAAMLVNVGPVLIALLAGRVLREGWPRWLLVGAGVAFAGAVLIGIATGGGRHADLLGVGLCLLAAVTYAVGVVAQKPVLGRLPALQVTALACAIGALATLPWAGALAGDLAAASATDVAGLVYLGLVPTAAAFGTWAYALSRTSAGRLGVTTYVVPVLTVVAGWLLLGEVPPPLALVGGALALVGVALSRRRSRTPVSSRG